MTTVYSATTLTGTDDGGGNSNQNIRQVLQTASLSSATGNQCQLQFRFGTACPTETGTITNVWFGQSGATEPDFAGDQVHVLFSAGATINGSAAGVVTSDVFTLAQNWDNSKKYTCSFHFKNASTGTSSIATAGTETLYNLAGTDNSSATTSAGMSSAVNRYFIQQVIVTAASGYVPYNPWPQAAPILAT